MYLIINTRCLALGIVFQLNASDSFRYTHYLNIAIKQTAVNKSVKHYCFTDLLVLGLSWYNVVFTPVSYISPIKVNICCSSNNKNLSPHFLWDSIQNIMWDFSDTHKVKRDLLHEFSARFWYFYAIIASPNFGLVGDLQLLRSVDFCH